VSAEEAYCAAPTELVIEAVAIKPIHQAQQLMETDVYDATSSIP
jgi:hypothetical protein